MRLKRIRVIFRYLKDGPAILNNLSLRIRPGEYVALVGGSGSGKSTLLRLLLGFEKPESGSVFYDGHDLASLDIREVRQQVGVVLQSSKLMPTDIYRNIIGSRNLTVNDAWEAARMAGLDRDIKNMPMGMHTVVSEGGGTFSGGQRQRLMIARALVNKPRIIFFDEATSALDNETQRIVTQSMDSMQATRIVIAHRLSTIVNADRIFVLHFGELVQSGSYDELMNQTGPFVELARRQLA
jgi:ABC-type bacteriocin/lantibiotic exporter with double-glycine peptidase domain